MNKASNNPPVIGQSWPEQGGIFIGTRLIDGIPHHVIVSDGIKHDIHDVKFIDVEKVIPKEINGHRDWRAPDHEELMLAYVNAREHFAQEGKTVRYWSRSIHHGWPWAVNFEYGISDYYYRDFEFHVRPFRTSPANTI